jgi:tetratricopeptide (TPR) repeat protein
MSQVRNDTNYYELLGVSPTATTAEIHAAYRALAVRFHPDVNTVENAEHLTMMLNQAWETLKNAELRKAYDATLPVSTEEPAEKEPGDVLKLPQCVRCGVESPSLSIVAFTWVVSFVVLSFRRPIEGIMCDPCRSKAAGRSALLTVLLGWWGLPLGPIFCFQSLYLVAIGGWRDWAANSALKRRMAIAYRQRGELNEALTCMEGAAYFAQDIDEGLADDLRQLHAQGAKRLPTRRILPGQFAAGVYNGMFFLSMALVVAAISQYTTTPTILQRCQQLNDGLHFREALPVCDQAVREAPLPAAFLQRGVARVFLGDYVGATSDLSLAIPSDPTNAYALTLRCRAYDETGKPTLALNDCDAALLTDASNVQALAWRCLARARLKDVDGALQDCDRAIALAPNNATAFANRCAAYTEGRDYKKALDDCNQAIALKPLDPAAFQHRCFAYLGLHDSRAAEADCDRAIALDGNLPYAYWGRGIARTSRHDPRGAADMRLARELFLKQGDTKTADKLKGTSPKKKAVTHRP